WSAEAVVNIQHLGAGARSAALGNSFAAVADNGDALFFNPAGLSQISKKQVAYTNVSLLFGGIEGDDLGQHLFSYAQPLGGRLGFGVGYERIGSELMSENGAFFGLSYKAGEGLRLGLTGKYLFWSVGEIPPDPVSNRADPLSNSSQGGIGLDLGLLWKSPFRGAMVGVEVVNLLKPSVAKGKVAGDADAGKVPMDLHVGVGQRFGVSLVSVEWVMRDVGGDAVDKRLVVGGETKLVEGLMVRAGGSKAFEEDGSGAVNAGLGYGWKQMWLDYSYHIPLELTETNGAHRFSLAYEF
ncbi:MAG: hypothetical protein HYW07_13880, partial [Candidatus Latescibacteria bacterium]|nr:hypothetical protein [Candidatus Latescibacterota bacterium]